jgi:hypothetical protein
LVAVLNEASYKTADEWKLGLIIAPTHGYAATREAAMAAFAKSWRRE